MLIQSCGVFGITVIYVKVLAHISGETIGYLQQSAAGIKESDFFVLKTNQCETCALTKSQHIISQSRNQSDGKNDFFFAGLSWSYAV